ncbi:MAG: hypothetical protein GEU78_09720 [Actinobacteria bacterium]|nr:hypothetical protein [Actinomycetota bacterium]
MPSDLVVTGTEELAKIGPALRAAPKDIRREFFVGVARAVKPLTASVIRSAPQFLPSGFAGEFASSLKTSTRRRMGSSPSVTLVGKAKSRRGKARQLAALNKGQLRHPVYGRPPWVTQTAGMRPGVWDKPLRDNVDEVREELLKVFEEVAEKIVRSV